MQNQHAVNERAFSLMCLLVLIPSNQQRPHIGLSCCWRPLDPQLKVKTWATDTPTPNIQYRVQHYVDSSTTMTVCNRRCKLNRAIIFQRFNQLAPEWFAFVETSNRFARTPLSSITWSELVSQILFFAQLANRVKMQTRNIIEYEETTHHE